MIFRTAVLIFIVMSWNNVSVRSPYPPAFCECPLFQFSKIKMGQQWKKSQPKEKKTKQKHIKSHLENSDR